MVRFGLARKFMGFSEHYRYVKMKKFEELVWARNLWQLEDGIEFSLFGIELNQRASYWSSVFLSSWNRVTYYIDPPKY